MARTPVRIWAAAGAAACVLLALIGWVFVVAPAQGKATTAWTELTTQQDLSNALRVDNTALRVKYQTIDAERAALATKRESLPQSDGLEALVLAFAQSATASGVTVEEITAGDPVDLSPVSSTPTTSTDTSADTSESTDADTEATVAPAVTEAAAPTLFVLPVTLRASGTVSDLEEFMLLVQSGQPRAILLTSVMMVPNTGGTTFDGTVMMTAETRVFVAPLGTAGADAEPVE